MAICAGPVQSFPRQGMEGDGSDACDAKAVDDRFRSAGVGLRHAPLRGLFDPASALILSSMLKEIPAGEGSCRTPLPRRILGASRQASGEAFDIRVVATRHSVRRGRDYVFSEGSTETSTPIYSCRIWHTTLSGPPGTCSRTAARRKGSHHPQFAEPAGLSAARGA